MAGAWLLLAALAAAPPEPAAPPTLTTTRHDEDWSALRDPAHRSGRFTDAFRFVPLDARGGAWLTSGLELRLREEAFADNLWGAAPAPDDGYLWLRALPHAGVQAGPLRGFVQLVATASEGVAPAPGPVDATGLDLLQGFGEARLDVPGGAGLELRAGRALVALGSERLVGARYGPNVPLAFDGVRASLRRGDDRVEVLHLHPVEAGAGAFDDRGSGRRALWGVYVTWADGAARATGVELYWLGYRNDRARFVQGDGRERRDTFGTRLAGSAGAWRWNVEAMLQRGRFAGAPIRAWSLATEVARAFPGPWLAPVATLRVNAASGDGDADDPRLQTFNALFPRGKYFGELSPLGPYNIVNLHPALELRPHPDVGLGIAAVGYWRQRRGDGIYDVPGQPLRATGGSRARHVGSQLEASLSWQATPELELSGSLSAFRAGRFLRETGPARTIRMLGLEANFRF